MRGRYQLNHFCTDALRLRVSTRGADEQGDWHDPLDVVVCAHHRALNHLYATERRTE